MIEIERKFLILNKTYKTEAVKSSKIIQGYLNTHPERTVRVRIKDNVAFITVKGKSNKSGLSRLEWEKEIEVSEAKILMNLCEKYIVEKIRYEIRIGQHTYEIDEFTGDNEGLVIAEIELNSEDEEFIKPTWLGKEVTGTKMYYNSLLSKKPYKFW